MVSGVIRWRQNGTNNADRRLNMSDRITRDQGRLLLDMARNSIAHALAAPGTGKGKDVDASFLNQKRGVFVSLHKQGLLRGCIGTIEPISTIKDAVNENAVFAALKDSRFSPVSRKELDQIDIEVSVLTQPVSLEYKDPDDLLSRLVPHQDGVVLQKGYRKATFLPQVWAQLPSAQAFLSHLCLKAGLNADAWEKEQLTISVYQVQSFSETQQAPEAQ